MTEMDAKTIQAIVKEGSMDVPPDVKAAAKKQYKAGSPGAEPYTVAVSYTHLTLPTKRIV